MTGTGAEQAIGGNAEGLANPEQGRERNGPSGFDLLPVSRREAKRNHILLAETFGFPKRAETHAQPRPNALSERILGLHLP